MLKNQLYIVARAIPWEIAKKQNLRLSNCFLKSFKDLGFR
jgi:hypothetical protein